MDKALKGLLAREWNIVRYKFKRLSILAINYISEELKGNYNDKSKDVSLTEEDAPLLLHVAWEMKIPSRSEGAVLDAKDARWLKQIGLLLK